jgi:CBS domain-containing protein
MRAKDIMVEGANLITIGPEESIFTAIRLMLKKHISGLPVVETTPQGSPRLVGIISEGDLLRRRETMTLRRRPRWLEFLVGPGKLAEEYAHAAGRKIREVMTAPVITVSEEAPLADVVQLMEQRNIKRIPVVRGDTLIGMITRADLLRALVREASKPLPLPANDAAIRDAILAELKKQPWGRNTMIDVEVRDGVVKLSGVIVDERERAAFVTVAENVPGVRMVEDHIAFVEPMSGMVIVSPEDEKRATKS